MRRKYIAILLIFFMSCNTMTAFAGSVKVPLIPRNTEKNEDKQPEPGTGIVKINPQNQDDEPIIDIATKPAEEPIISPSSAAQVYANKITVNNGKVTAQVINYPILDLLNTVFDKLDKKIIINSKIQGYVSIRVTDLEAGEFLNLLSTSLGFSWKKDGDIYIVSSDDILTSPDFFPVKYADLNDIKNTLNALGLGNKLLINAYPRGIFVNAPPEVKRDLAAVISKLDIAAPSIKVEFKVVEMSKDEEKKAGISWQDVTGSYQYSHTGGATGITQGFSTGLIGSAQATKSIGKILARPYVITLNNVEAHLSTGDEVPIFSKDINGYPSVEYKKVGIELYATPAVVNIDDETINIKAKTIVNIISGQETQQGLTAPQISSREAQTVMNVKSGETIVIGGLLKEQDIMNQTGMPLLSKLPLLGNLFKITTKSKTNTEIIIFITPTLIQPEK